MGRTVLGWRLVVADLRRRRGEAALLLLAILAATTTLTLGLVLHGQTDDPYQRTRIATAGADVTAYTFAPHLGHVPVADIARLTNLAHRPGVTAASGPYPLTWATLRTPTVRATAEVIGRDQRPARIDQPKLTQGHWIRPGAVVLERSFAAALGAHPGESITLNGRSFIIAGIAVSATVPPYPRVCSAGCDISPSVGSFSPTGLAWLTRNDTRHLATRIEPLAYTLSLRLADPDRASGSADAIHPGSNTFATSWQQVRASDAKLESNERAALLLGSWLLGILAIASCTVLVGGRMAHQLRWAGLLKAVGGTPALITAVLLAQYLLISLVAAALGLGTGRLISPLLADPGSGLLGTAGAPPFTPATGAVVIATALSIAGLATLVPRFEPPVPAPFGR